MTRAPKPPAPPPRATAEERARAAEAEAERVRRLMDVAPDAMVLVRRDGTLAWANPAFARMVGSVGPAELMGLPMSRFLSAPFLKSVRSEIVGLPNEGAANTSADTLRRLDGAARAVEVAAVPFLHEGQPAAQMFIRDVTDRKALVDARREAEARLNLVLEQAPAVLWTTGPDLRLATSRGGSALAAQFAGAVGRDVAGLFGAVVAPEVLVAHERARRGESARLAVNWIGRDFELRVDGLRDADGALTGTVGVALDVTERKQAEARAREVAQHDALARIAGGVAHEMNNVLASIVGLASGLEMSRLLHPQLKASVVGILASGRRGRDLVSNLLGYARGGRYRRERIVLNSVAREAAARLSERRLPDLHLDLDLADALPPVEGDPVQLLAAVENLLQNSLDASLDGGRITIATRSLDVDADSPLHPELPPGAYAVIEIRDTGSGMPEDVRAQALHPFFTTKPLGGGPGLGLSMAHGVARHHGGTLTVASTPGQGTTVCIFLPVVEGFRAAPDVRPPLGQRAVPPTERPPVLVIDDDEWVRFSTTQLLEALGYAVTAAEGGREGLARFREPGVHFDLVILDLRMPGMDGEEVLQHLLAADPEARVILCTGYERDQVSQHLFALGHVGFLGKPFTIAELEAQMRAVGMAPLERVHAPA